MAAIQVTQTEKRAPARPSEIKQSGKEAKRGQTPAPRRPVPEVKQVFTDWAAF